MAKVFNRDLRLTGKSSLYMNDVKIIDGNTGMATTPSGPASVTTLAVSGDVAVATDKFTVAADTGNTVIAGTLTVAGATGFNGGIVLGAGDNLVGSSTSNIVIDTDKFTVAGATGNTAVKGTLAVTGTSVFTGGITANGGVTLGAGDSLIGSATSDITFNTDKFTVAGATGNTVVAGTLQVTGAVTHTSTTLCSDNVTIASAKGIIGAGTGANGFTIKNPKNGAAGSLSGTALNVEIDIGGTPYYFAVYPTKS